MVAQTSQICTFDGDSLSYSSPSWKELTDLSFDLSQQLRNSHKHFDVIVTLAKGGWPLARILADFLNIETCISLGVKFYKDLTEKVDEPFIYQDIAPAMQVQGKKVLLFDDVADTGDSLLFGKEYLQKMGVSSITTAALFYKKRSQVLPDFFADENNSWIIFPFEACETVRSLEERWTKQEIPVQEQKKRFVQLGLGGIVIQT